MPNCAGGMTIVQLGADMSNERVQTSVDKCRRVQISVDSVLTESKVVYTP